MRKKGRKLSDHGLWEQVRKTVKPMHPGKDKETGDEEEFANLLSAANRYPAALSREKSLSRSRPDAGQLRKLQDLGLAGNGIRPQTGQRINPTPLFLDEKTRRNITRGKIAIDATIDLHGMTQMQAHGRLKQFIRMAQNINNRVILVITGKGSDGQGALKRVVPHWLEEDTMRHMVSGYSQAHQSHGGSGALYVRIRRNRDK